MNRVFRDPETSRLYGLLKESKEALAAHEAMTEEILAERQAQGQGIRDDISAIERVLSKLSADPIQSTTKTVRPRGESNGRPVEQERLALVEGSFAHHAAEILGKASGPLHTMDLVKRIRKRTDQWNGMGETKLRAHFYSAMWRRQDHFIQFKKGVWGLVGRDEHYTPGSAEKWAEDHATKDG